MASALDILIGSGPGQRAVILGTLGLYTYLFYARPADGKAAVRNGLVLFGRLFTLILSALLLASAIGALVPAARIRQMLGETAGVGGTVLAGLLGGGLPGGPYAVYPLIQGVQIAGAGLAAALAMLIGYGAIGLGRVPYGLVFFEWKTIALRVAVGIPATILVAVGVYLIV